jgi:hypothetical protein
MSRLTPHRISPAQLSLFLARCAARTRMRDFFSSHIRNANTHRPYIETLDSSARRRFRA